MMKSIFHPSTERGHAYFGWLDSYHSFSFGEFHDPSKVHFGALRVLNDDTVAGGKGFGFHPHSNMEIISIPLEGDLEHKDNMGNQAIIRHGDVQVMSAGTGIVHSEYNKSQETPVKFLQIWIIPGRQGVKPRYQQITLGALKENALTQIVSPDEKDAGVWIHQDAWFNLGKFSSDQSIAYTIKKPGNGAYLFVLSGKVEINGQLLNTRDAYGIWDVEHVDIKIKEDVSFLIIDVPMDL